MDTLGTPQKARRCDYGASSPSALAAGFAADNSAIRGAGTSASRLVRIERPSGRRIQMFANRRGIRATRRSMTNRIVRKPTQLSCVLQKRKGKV
jgi:hypothetical protein